MQLNGTHPGLCNGFGVHIRVNVRLHYTDAHLLLQAADNAPQSGGLAAARGGHQIHQKGLFCFQLGPKFLRLPVVTLKHAFFDLNDFIRFHKHLSVFRIYYV